MQSAAEQIKDRLPITDVLSSYITLISAGRQYKAKCPFHNERTASFSISPERGLYYCFGCGAKGDVFTFVQQFEGVDFNGALKILAQRAGVELKANDKRADDLDPVYECLEKTTLRYQNELQKNNEALLYLKGRGLTPETISQFRIGYAPVEWRFVADSCVDEKEKRIAERAGLIKQPEKEGETQKRHYDRFRGRIMFPLSDSSGRVVGFSGRIFPETPEGPKYLNSPETEVFQKSRVLYGFDKAKMHIKRAGFAIMVEGQMDLILSHQAGFKNTVATSGTAVSEMSAEDEKANLVTLSRLSPHLFMAFDGDNAGQKALSRAALVALSLGMNPKVVPVPAGVDPAEYILKEGAEKWKEHLKGSEHFIVHQARTVAQSGQSAHMLVRALRESVFPYLSRVTSPIEQNLYIEAVAKEVRVPAADVGRELAQFVAAIPVQRTETVAAPVTEEESGPSVVERFFAFAERFPIEEVLKQKEMLSTLSFEAYAIEKKELSPERAALVLATVERDYAALSDEEHSAAATELAAKVREQFFSNIRASIGSALRIAEREGNEEDAAKLLSSLTELNKRQYAST